MSYDPRQWINYGDYNAQIENNEFLPEKKLEYSYSPAENKYIAPSFYETKSNEVNSNFNTGNKTKKRNVDEYDPACPAFNATPVQKTTQQKNLPDPRKLDEFISKLQRMIRPLPYDYKKMLPYDVICQLSHAMLDGTVFEIANGLRDIQRITEKNLHAKRTQLVNEHRARKQEIKKRHRTDIENSHSRPHQILVYEKKHAEELKAFKERIDKEITTMDQKLVLDLDQQVSDQQVTLERAGLPLFYITNNQEEIRIQMYILGFIAKLSGAA